MTVYYQFGSKTGLLEASCAIRSAARGGLLEQLPGAYCQADPCAALDELIRAFRRSGPPTAWWRAACTRLAALDPEIDKVLQARQERRRRGLGVIVGRLDRGGHLAGEAPAEEVTAQLHVLTSFETFDTLAVRGPRPRGRGAAGATAGARRGGSGRGYAPSRPSAARRPPCGPGAAGVNCLTAENRPSQGTDIAPAAAEDRVVAFKVEEELADLLNKLPNKSAFIRKAIAAQLGMACPLCNGKGVVPRGVHDHYAAAAQAAQPAPAATAAATSCRCRSTPATWPPRTATGWSSSSTAARSTATAATTRPPPATTAAGTSPPNASPSTTARHTTIDAPSLNELRTPVAAPLPHPDADALRACADQALDWLVAPPRHAARPGHRSHRLAAPRWKPLLREPPPEARQDFAAVLAEFADKVAAHCCPRQPPALPRLHPVGADLRLDAGRLAVCRHQLLRRRLAGGGRGRPQVELVVLDWFKEFLGYPPEAPAS